MNAPFTTCYSLAITSDEGLQEQAYAILRNLAFPSSEVGFLLSGLGQETIIEVTEIGMASSAGEILTQVRCGLTHSSLLNRHCAEHWIVHEPDRWIE